LSAGRRGFTLLELVVVIIIISVLASLALPKLFGMIEFSKSAEALAQLASMRGSIERCYLSTGNYSPCWFPSLDIDVEMNWPTAIAAGADFVYGTPAGYANSQRFAISAYRVRNGQVHSVDHIMLYQDGVSIQKCGGGVFRALGECPPGFPGVPSNE